MPNRGSAMHAGASYGCEMGAMRPPDHGGSSGGGMPLDYHLSSNYSRRIDAQAAARGGAASAQPRPAAAGMCMYIQFSRPSWAVPMVVGLRASGSEVLDTAFHTARNYTGVRQRRAEVVSVGITGLTLQHVRLCLAPPP